ncbi:MAG TPA: serine protease, partial [Actinomycetota bacterium]|nr:serine protease [Actinomycetota bacterium]
MASTGSIPPKTLIVVVVAAVLGGLVGGLLVKLASNGSNSLEGQAVCVATTVADEVLPSVVTVQVAGQAGGGTGTGELIRDDGTILTNDHVIAAAANGGSLSVRYADGTTSPATIVG